MTRPPPGAIAPSTIAPGTILSDSIPSSTGAPSASVPSGTSAPKSIAPSTIALGTIARAIHDGAAQLGHIADNPRLEARLLLAHATGLTQNDLIRDPARPIDPTRFHTLLARRAASEPIARILGNREFWSMQFDVSAATLVPRPDSETLIEAAIAAFANRAPPASILDLGTGTGCLLLALLRQFPTAWGIGVDLSAPAAALARRNAVQLGLAERSGFIVADWTNSTCGHFDLIISNPPYIPAAEIETLMPEVARYEPRRALDGGSDGCDAYRTILPRLARHLTPDGVAILELGRGQANYVHGLAREAGLDGSLRLDLARIPRALVLHRSSC
ncbi:peptide chain release factor N(5)-glutamine methyltransferase [Rhodopila sp.]|uniref:peptide chain release factor N(5)-glutamine methyltransferase n=1 Tax=Rhodopila sp. TaxID=2480087 RepID=UPI003D13D7C6